MLCINTLCKVIMELPLTPKGVYNCAITSIIHSYYVCVHNMHAMLYHMKALNFT